MLAILWVLTWALTSHHSAHYLHRQLQSLVRKKRTPFAIAAMVEQPYLYDAPSSNRPVSYPYSDFNPRAATQAHYAAFQERAEKAKRRAAQDGKPLINFNQHPDSYMIVANPAINHEPLPPNTKRNIVWTRWVQFVLRLFQEVGALGILVCVICLKMNSDGPGWVIRVAVGHS